MPAFLLSWFTSRVIQRQMSFWANAPLYDPQMAKLLNKLNFVVMDPCLNMKREDPSIADYNAMRQDIKALGGELPIIVVYDARRGGVVIRPENESDNERKERVGKILRDYCARLEAAD
jgi:hypothetical protein